jgi:hypothetical protein
MNKIFDYITAHSDWLSPFVPLLCVVVWFAIESRWAFNYPHLVRLLSSGIARVNL